MRNTIRKITVGEYAVLAMSFLTGLAITGVMLASAIMHGIPDLWVGAFMLGMVVFGWSPFVGFAAASMHNVEGWSYEAGCYDKWVVWHDQHMQVFVAKRPKSRHAYRIAILALTSDPFGESMEVVHEYDDYGPLHSVLSLAEASAIDIMIGEYTGHIEL